MNAPLEEKLHTIVSEQIEKVGTPMEEITQIDSNDKKVIEDVLLKVESWLKTWTPDSSFTTEPFNSFMRRLVRQEVTKKYETAVM